MDSFQSNFNPCLAGKAKMTLIYGQNILFMPTDITFIALLHIGLSPTDSFDEAIADMIVGGVEDIYEPLMKAYMEKEAAKKVPGSPPYDLYHLSLQISIPHLLITFRSPLFATVFTSVSPILSLAQPAPIVFLSAPSFPLLVWSTNFLTTLPLPCFLIWLVLSASNVSLPSSFSPLQSLSSSHLPLVLSFLPPPAFLPPLPCYPPTSVTVSFVVPFSLMQSFPH